MVDVVVRSMLGPAGSRLLDFYLQNSLWINGLIFAYIILLIISRRVYRQTLVFLCAWAEEKIASRSKLDRNQVATALRRMNLPWEEAQKTSIFPLIARPSGLVVYLRTKLLLENWITAEVLAEALIDKQKKNII